MQSHSFTNISSSPFNLMINNLQNQQDAVTIEKIKEELWTGNTNSYFNNANNNVTPSTFTSKNSKKYNFISFDKINSSVSKSIHKSINSLSLFFSKSLNYSISQINDIQQDLVVNPLSASFSATTKKTKLNLKKFLTIGALTVAMQFLGTALHNTNTEDYTNKQLTTPQISQTVQNTTNTTVLTTTDQPFYQNSFSQLIMQSLSNSNPIDTLQNELPKTLMKTPQYMQSMFSSKSDAFLHLLKAAEGKQNQFYRDNKGIAIGYGWNPTRNTKEFNLAIANQSGLNLEQTLAIIKVSDTNKVNYVPKDLKKIQLSSEQVDKTAIALMPNYEQQFLDAMTYHSVKNGRNPDKDIQLYNSLPNNQQAVMIHMAYKVGGDNLVNYKTFYKKLFKYMDTPNKTTMHQVQQNFQYTYSDLHGQKFHDSRVETIHTGFFSDCSVNSPVNNSQLQTNQTDLHFKHYTKATKENLAAKINQCRNIANITNPDEVKEIKNNIATVQSRMSKILG